MPSRLLIRAAVLVLLLAACTDGTATSTPSATFSGPVSATPSSEPTTTFSANLTPATVTRVIDGDTIKVEIEGREYTVRYIGINSPETVDPRRPVE